MHEDTVLRELHETKDRMAARYAYDARRLVKALMRRQRSARRKAARPARRAVAPRA